MSAWLRAGIIIISLLLSMYFTLTSFAQTQTLVRLDPSQTKLDSGDTNLIQVRIDNAEELFGYEIHLEFDPNLVQIVDNDQEASGVQVQHGDVFNVEESFLVTNEVDNQAGTIVYAITQLAPAEAISGDGILLSLEVKATSPGASELRLSSVILASTEGTSLPFESEDGRIVVQGGETESQNFTTDPTTQTESTDNLVFDSSQDIADEGINKRQKADWKVIAGVSGISILGLVFALFFIVNKKRKDDIK